MISEIFDCLGTLPKQSKQLSCSNALGCELTNVRYMLRSAITRALPKYICVFSYGFAVEFFLKTAPVGTCMDYV